MPFFIHLVFDWYLTTVALLCIQFAMQTAIFSICRSSSAPFNNWISHLIGWNSNTMHNILTNFMVAICLFPSINQIKSNNFNLNQQQMKNSFLMTKKSSSQFKCSILNVAQLFISIASMSKFTKQNTNSTVSPKSS